MIGILYYSLFLVMGILYSDILFKDKNLWFKIWAGGIIGNVALMFGIVPLASMLGFTKLCHIILALLFTGIYFCLKKRPDLKFSLPYKPAFYAVLGISVIIWAILENHILAPIAGGVASGQSTYGDLAMHMGFVTSIAEQGTFPPQYNLLSGTRLCYPFLEDSLSSSLYLFGTSLRNAVLYPSTVLSALTVMGFYFLAERLTENRKAAVLAAVIFFLGGGLGFSYFLDGAAENSNVFTRIFTDYYKTPTNLNEHNIRWANPICDMIVPQRTTMAGWCVLFFALWLLIDAIQTKDRKRFLLLGAVAGAMPMIHTHSFLALGVLSAVWFFVFLPKDKKEFQNWVIYGGIALTAALPQLFFWTFSQSVGNEQFLRFGFNWVNKADPYLWFWLKNWGITAIFVIPAVMASKREQKKLFLGIAVLFALAETVIFQPNEYDNNKLFFVCYAFCVIIVSDYLLYLFDKLKGVPGRGFFASMIIFFAVFSGVLTIGREYVSGREYQTFSSSDIEFAEFVKDNTDPEAVFASANQHLNPVSVLAGRNLYAGSELYVYFHGLGEKMNKRYNKLRTIYESKTPKELSQNLKSVPEIDYILITSNEKSAYNITMSAFSEIPIMYNKDGICLLGVKNWSKSIALPAN